MATAGIKWRWCILVTFSVVFLTALPQALFVMDRGKDWHGTNAIMHPDEVAYSAYLASLIRGEPRRNDPYTVGQQRPEGTVPESLFSIQMVPAYAAAVAARWLGLSASQTFIFFPLLSAATTSVAIFWLITLLVRDERIGATAVWIILGFGTLIAGQGSVRHFLTLPFLIPQSVANSFAPPSVYHLPFIRFYQPAIAFPLFFLLCALVWLGLTLERDRTSAFTAAGAGLTVVLLIFSYFFLWTAAAAWLVCISTLWVLFRREELKRTLMVFGLMAMIALPGLAVYFRMLSQRAATVDSVQALELTHRPDPFRLSEIVAIIVVAMLILGVRRGLFLGRDRVVLFAASLCLAVLVIFNQQVITGRSLQPIHYEWFIGNYLALAAVVLAATLWWRSRESRVGSLESKSESGLSDSALQTPDSRIRKWLAGFGVAALLWALCEVWLAASLSLPYNRLIDGGRPVSDHLALLARTNTTWSSPGNAGSLAGTVLMEDLRLADRLPSDAPQGVLWAPRMLVFPGVTEAENRERFFRQLYYLGFDERKFMAEADGGDWNFFAGLFPYDRLSPAVSGNKRGISNDEVRAQLRNYLSYAKSFNRERATSPTISYLVVSAENEPNYSNLDLWYARGAGQRIGDYKIYNLTLKD